MLIDGTLLHTIKAELKIKLIDSRVSKISQPYPREIIITLRNQKQHVNYNLLLSANPNFARAQITNIPFTNPNTPNKFTMTLRKYLDGSHLTDIQQLDNDRVIIFKFSSRNELGDLYDLNLTLEIMNRHSNLFLVNQKDQKIIDLIQHINPDQNQFRTLLPGGTYINPPKQLNKHNPFNFNDSKFINQLVNDYPNEDVLAKQLQQYFQGLSFSTALLLAKALHQSNNANNLIHFKNFFAQFDDIEKIIQLLKEQNDLKQTFSSISDLLDYVYKEKAERDRVNSIGKQLIHIIKQNLNKNRKKIKKLKLEFNQAQQAEQFKIKGELLTTYLNLIKPKTEEITLNNYYDNNQPIKINLSPQLSPSQNAQKYFKKYHKLRNAQTYVQQQIDLTNREINYLENLQSEIELASPDDINDIKNEMQQVGYLKINTKKKKQLKRKNDQPRKFILSDQVELLIGKNNLQNDQLTLHKARKDYYWFHVKDLPGSHAILTTNEPSDALIVTAAQAAAYYSKARNSTHVPVDYVQVKYIHKPQGAKPGFVTYTHQKNILVEPKLPTNEN